MLTLYGIPNCDTVKKARGWLAEHGLAYTFQPIFLSYRPPQALSPGFGLGAQANIRSTI